MRVTKTWNTRPELISRTYSPPSGEGNTKTLWWPPTGNWKSCGSHNSKRVKLVVIDRPHNHVLFLNFHKVWSLSTTTISLGELTKKSLARTNGISKASLVPCDPYKELILPVTFVRGFLSSACQHLHIHVFVIETLSILSFGILFAKALITLYAISPHTAVLHPHSPTLPNTVLDDCPYTLHRVPWFLFETISYS